jgi:hypothetical protein
MQVVVQKTTFAQDALLAARNLKNSDGQTSSKNCSLNRDVECPSVGTTFGSSRERPAMAVRYTIAAKKAPNPTDQHIGSRVRMGRHSAERAQPAEWGDPRRSAQRHEGDRHRLDRRLWESLVGRARRSRQGGVGVPQLPRLRVGVTMAFPTDRRMRSRAEQRLPPQRLAPRAQEQGHARAR